MENNMRSEHNNAQIELNEDLRTTKKRFQLWVVWLDGNFFTYDTWNKKVKIRSQYDALRYLCTRIEIFGHRMKLAYLYDNKYPKGDPRHLLAEINEGRVGYESDTLKKLAFDKVKINQSNIKAYKG